MADPRYNGSPSVFPSSRISNFQPTRATGVGFASHPATPATNYLAPDQTFGRIPIEGMVTQEPPPTVYGSMPSKPPRRGFTSVYNIDVNQRSSTNPDIRHVGAAVPSSDASRLPPGYDPNGVVNLHQRGRLYRTAANEQIGTEEADTLLELQNPTDMGLHVENIGLLNPRERASLFEALWAAGSLVFTPYFISRMQRWVWPYIVFACLAFVGTVVGAVLAIILVVGEVDFNLRSFLLFLVIFNFIVIGLGLTLTGLEYGRKNTDLSPWHRKAIFMPILMVVFMALLSIITLAVHNKVDGSAVNRDNLTDYSALVFCMVILVLSPPIVGQWIVPAIISSIYPECEGPELMTLAPDGLDRIYEQYIDVQQRTPGGQRQRNA